MKKNWDLKLFYKSNKDPQILKDLNKFKKAHSNFTNKYRKNKDYLKKPDSLFRALNGLENLMEMDGYDRPILYFLYKESLNSNDKEVSARISKLTEEYTKLENEIEFFFLDLANIDKKKQKEFLNSKKLSDFKYFLEKQFKKSDYVLSEKEEKLINLLNIPANDMWVSGFSKVLNNLTIKFKDKKITVTEGMALINESGAKERKELHKLCMEELKKVSSFAESEINAVFQTKKITDELRGFEKPYSETVLKYENEDKTVDNLVDIITKNYKISHRFYKIKAKLLKKNKLDYEDRSAKVGNLSKNYNFEETTRLLKEAFFKVSPYYKDTFESYLKSGQIDFFPNKGKSGGAFCSSSYKNPTMVLLNHVNNFNSVVTLGHEMGHAFHSEFSKKQNPIYAGHTISTAEVASTFFENFVFDHVFETLNEREKIIALHDRINSSISTIFRQIACFNFENDLHNKIREEGYVSAEGISKLLNKHMKDYLGPKFEMKENDGYFFELWGHIRRPFYVYSYAFGEIVSSALYAKYKDDKDYIKKVEGFMTAGESKSPEDIFKEIGINVRDKKFFEIGLKNIEEDIKRLEKLIG